MDAFLCRDKQNKKMLTKNQAILAIGILHLNLNTIEFKTIKFDVIKQNRLLKF